MWKTRGNRIRQLLRLGVKRKDAILHGLVGRGCWARRREARAASPALCLQRAGDAPQAFPPVINQALSLQWLRKPGLPSLTEQWGEIHYPTTVR